MCQPYIESATALADYDEELQEFLVFVGPHKWTFSVLAGPRNVSADLKYDVLCL